MEEQSLLQQMEYLNRKIRLLQALQSERSRKPANMSSSSSSKSKYWHGQTKIDNRLKHSTSSKSSTTKLNGAQSSQYQFKRTSGVSAINMYARSNSLLKSVLTPKISPLKKLLPKISNMYYVNPHFRPENIERTHVESNVQTTINPAQPVSYSTSKLPAKSTGKTPLLLNPESGLSNESTDISLRSSAPATTLQDNGTLQVSDDSILPNNNYSKVKNNIHVNRLVYPSNDDAKARVLVNPKVFARLKSEVRRESPPRFITPVSRAKVKFASGSNRKSFVAVGRNKIVRVRKLSFQVTPPRVRSLSSKPISSLTKIAKSVCSKYKYIRTSSSAPKPLPRLPSKISPVVRTNYTLDRRLNKSQKRFKDVKKYSLKYASLTARAPESNLQGIMMHKRRSAGFKSSFSNQVWSHHRSFQPTKVIITDQKLLKIGRCSTPRPHTTKTVRSPQSSTLLRIGGILYKSSRNVLARSNNVSKSESTPMRNFNASVVRSENRRSRLKTAGGLFVHVRGNKFLMDPTGKTLKRISDASNPKKGQLRRVDLGGATFIQKTANVLIRTNTHVVRSLLSQARQRSIFTLSKRMQKNNTACKFFRQFGKCFRHEKNRCLCIHDKKQVAICKSHLHGECKKANCLLSHELIPEKMPTCEHFLQLSCTRVDCPYLHIKLNSKAPLCIGFLQGYCADGLRCRKWHFNICPLFDKTGRCSKGKYCPYPHKARRHVELNRNHMDEGVDHIMSMYEDRTKLVESSKSDKSFRYFNAQHDVDNEAVGVVEFPSNKDRSDSQASESEELGLVGSTEEMEIVDTSNTSLEGSDSSSPVSLAKRRSIGFLPSYIPLN